MLVRRVCYIRKERARKSRKMEYFFKLGLSLLTQRRRQDLPVRCKSPLERMELQSLGPYLFTWFISTSSSSAFHGPFFISSLSPSILNFTPFLSSFLCNFSFSLFFLVWWRLKRLLAPPTSHYSPTFPHFFLYFQNFQIYHHAPMIFLITPNTTLAVTKFYLIFFFSNCLWIFVENFSTGHVG